MSVLTELDYNKKILIDQHYLYGSQELSLFLEKTYFPSNFKEQYFLKLFNRNLNGNYECLGYIYFYMDFQTMTSDFIGLYVKPECRNNGLASLLISNWIKLCLDSGLYNLETIKKQRKPIFLYSLKKFAFEIENPEDYQTSPFTISICEGIHNHLKYLYFKNYKQRDTFIKGTIMRETEYNILEKLSNNFFVLDQVLLSNTYFIQDENAAYTRSLKCINHNKK